MKDDPELRRRVNENLRRLASGEVAREVAREKELRAAHKAKLKRNSRRIKTIKARLAVVRKEHDGLQEYLEELLLKEDPNPFGYAEGMSDEQYNGLLEECDAAVEGCSAEIADLVQELEALERAEVDDVLSTMRVIIPGA